MNILARLGAGVVWLSAYHSDIEEFISSKKINADDDMRLKTLSIGVGLDGFILEKAKKDEDYYVFYPHTVYKEYGVPFADISAEMGKWYEKLVNNPNVRKRKVNARNLLQSIAFTLGESGYPFIAFLDNINRQKANDGLIKFSNLCTEILEPTTVTKYKPYHESDKDEIGLGVSCNLASLNIDNVMKNKSIKEAVENAMLIMNAVSDETDVKFVKEIERANRERHSVGLGVMGLHSYLARSYIAYGSEESIDFVDVFFNIVNYYSLKYSNEIAKEKGVYLGFENSKYADGSYFDKRGEILPKHEKVEKLFEGIDIPTNEDWKQLKEDVMKYGLYNSERLAIAPKLVGSIIVR